MRRLFAMLLLSVCSAALAACGAQPTPLPTPASREGASYLRSQIALLDRMEVPQGVEPALWRELAHGLRTQLQARLDSGRTALAAPTGNLSQAALSLDAGTQTLSWYYACQGDNDQN